MKSYSVLAIKELRNSLSPIGPTCFTLYWSILSFSAPEMFPEFPGCPGPVWFLFYVRNRNVASILK